MKKQLAIDEIIILESELALKWNDSKESYVSFQILRDNCPCAFCSGETDALGNVYKGPKKKLEKNSYEAMKVEKVGHYALRFYWGDQHSDGLFTYNLLRILGDSYES